MKKIFVISLLSALTVCFNYTYTQTVYKIPGATKQPAWVFPIWFENGDGQRDTVYIAYDPTATTYWGSANHDTIFGEKYITQDTAKFIAYWWVGGNWPNNIVKVTVDTFGGGGLIEFNKVKFPLKMSWDNRLFYSNSLPFYKGSTSYPDTLPKAYGILSCNDPNSEYWNCNFTGESANYLLTDDPLNYFPFYNNACFFSPPGSLPYSGPAPCHASDSIIWYGDTIIGMDPLVFSINIYDKLTGIKEVKSKTEKCVIYPNPFTVSATIEIDNLKRSDYDLFVYDIFGRQVKKIRIENKKSKIENDNLKSGIYFYRLMNNKEIFHIGKIMIQ